MPLSVYIDGLLFVGGLAALIVGGDGMVRGAADLARRLGISPLVVGLTVVAFGTSAPELAVSLASGLHDAAPLALGNVVGSNIFNILLILGFAAAVTALPVARRLLVFDLPFMAGAAVLLVLLSLDGMITLSDGAILFSLLVAYIALNIVLARRGTVKALPVDEPEADGGVSRTDLILGGGATALVWVGLANDRIGASGGLGLVAALALFLLLVFVSARRGPSTATDVLLVLLGIAVVALSADCMVTGAVGVARQAGVSEAVIGLTVVAAGTSLPEAVASILACRRGEPDIAVGNVIGSNIFNVLCIVGLTGLIVPLPLAPEIAQFDYAVMIGCTALLWLIAWRWRSILRWHGALMLGCFVAYMAAQWARL